MKILLSYIHYPVCSGRYVKDALKRLGHDVKSCGYIERLPWAPHIEPHHFPDGPLDGTFPEWTPDLVIVMESAWAFHHPVYGDVPHVVYGVDNHVRDYRQAGITHYFLAHKATSIMDMSSKDVTWLPCGYDPVAFRPSVIPFDEREYDVTLIGVLYPLRVEILEALDNAGLKVQAGTGLLYEDYANAYHNSRIALNVSANGDLNQRIFETIALGCVLLTHPVADFDLKVLKKTPMLPYDSTEHAVEVAVSFLKDAKKAGECPLPIAGIADLGIEKHTWDARAQIMVDWYQTTYQTKDSKRARQSKAD